MGRKQRLDLQLVALGLATSRQQAWGKLVQWEVEHRKLTAVA